MDAISLDDISVEGDPHAVNLAGEKFEILATGPLAFLSIWPNSSRHSDDHPLLTLYGTVGQAETCHNTFTRNISLTGIWITENAALDEIGVRAVEGVAESEQLEIRLGGDWQTARDISPRHIVTKATEETVIISVHGLTVQADIARGHSISYIDLKVSGACALSKSFYVGGLLGLDDHTFASSESDACKERRSSAKFISSASATDTSGGCPSSA
jgi:hypothetical protein